MDGWRNGPRPVAQRPTPAVVKASRELEKAQASYDQARTGWEQAASTRLTADAELLAGSRDVMVGGQLVTHRPPGAPERIARLREVEAQARAEMDRLGAELVEVRRQAAPLSG